MRLEEVTEERDGGDEINRALWLIRWSRRSSLAESPLSLEQLEGALHFEKW